jgi:hypothetical protein
MVQRPEKPMKKCHFFEKTIFVLKVRIGIRVRVFISEFKMALVMLYGEKQAE